MDIDNSWDLENSETGDAEWLVWKVTVSPLVFRRHWYCYLRWLIEHALPFEIRPIRGCSNWISRPTYYHANLIDSNCHFGRYYIYCWNVAISFNYFSLSNLDFNLRSIQHLNLNAPLLLYSSKMDVETWKTTQRARDDIKRPVKPMSNHTTLSYADGLFRYGDSIR